VKYVDFVFAHNGGIGERFKRREERWISECDLGHIGNRTHLGATDEQQQD
jgi:hypothetical protein